MMRLYHTTTADAADAILHEGFHDTAGHYGFVDKSRQPIDNTGVWFADRPLGVNEGAADDPVFGAPILVIDVDEDAIAAYELTTGPESEAYREWCIPAELANSHLLGKIYDPLENGNSDAWWETMEPMR